MDNRNFPNSSGTAESKFSNGEGKVRKNFGARQFSKERFTKGQSDRRKPNRGKFDKGPRSDQKRKMNMAPKDGAVRKPARTSTFGKRKSFGKK